jgi:hypothetical protein
VIDVAAINEAMFVTHAGHRQGDALTPSRRRDECLLLGEQRKTFARGEDFAF